MYLVDAGVNTEVTSIASVSGGSLTNAMVGQTLDFRSTDSETFRKTVAGPLATQIAEKGTFYAPIRTKLYLLALGVLGIAVLIYLAIDWAWYLRFALFVALLGSWGWLFSKRSVLCAKAFEETVFSPKGRPTLLSDLTKETLDHIICATELRAAEQICFSGSFVYSFCLGHGIPSDLKLASAVQASACFPGGFAPTRLAAGRHQFTGAPDIPACTAAERTQLVMTDGGVYDNMGDQWARGFRERVKRWPDLGQHRVAPDRLVVVNASARFPWVPFHHGQVPIVGEILALYRVLDVMYVNTTNVRRQEIVASFDPVHPELAATLATVLIQIAQSPFVVPKFFSNGTGDVAQRAQTVLSALGNTEKEWQQIAENNARVGTTLSKLGKEVSARLLYHGYVVAMCNLYVLLGPTFQFLPVQINLTRFQALIN